MTDHLRDRLARLDPLRADTTTPAAPPADLLEHIMTTDTTTTHAPLTPLRRRHRWLAAAAAVAALGVTAGVAATALTGDDPTRPPLALQLPGGDPTTSMCLAFDPATLTDMPIAFEGRATAVTDGQVTLDVAHWYQGGDADQVTLAATPGMAALIDGLEFAEGGEYLITATDQTVNFCGYSSVATDDTRAVWDAAFAG